MLAAGIFIGGLPVGFVLGTFGEYWIHRSMHWGLFLSERHGNHHRDGSGQGAFDEFRDYVLGVPIAAILFLPLDYYYFSGGIVGAGVVCGVFIHAVVAGWCHQAQHEDPRLVPWLSKMPIHFVHHKLAQGRHNFGISVNWWDRAFGTYKPEPNWCSLVDPGSSTRSWWQLFWIEKQLSRHPIRGPQTQPRDRLPL